MPVRAIDFTAATAATASPRSPRTPRSPSVSKTVPSAPKKKDTPLRNYLRDMRMRAVQYSGIRKELFANDNESDDEFNHILDFE